MSHSDDKSCYNCFWLWHSPDGAARCTRMPPVPILHDPVGLDVTIINKVSYMPVPGIPACGEWLANEEEVIEEEGENDIGDVNNDDDVTLTDDEHE